MEQYLRRARAAIDEFRAALRKLNPQQLRAEADTNASRKQAEKIPDIIERVEEAVRRLEHSLDQIGGETALDVVDLQVRMEGEGAALASALKQLGEVVTSSPDLVPHAGTTFYELDERAERVAAALFPSAIEGVREINRALWDFRPIWADYTRTLTREVTRRGDGALTSDQLKKVQETAGAVRARFDGVNELLNQLVIGRASEPGAVQQLIRQAREALSAAIREAKSKAADVYKPFHGVLKRAASLAKKIDGQFAKLRVPVFPPPDRLGVLGSVVDPDWYGELSGVERFALLNITARLHSISLEDGGHLLAPHFQVRVFDAFPDRVYFTTTPAFVSTVARLMAQGIFEKAPASLHRFKDGSFKQRRSRKGNLQISYAFCTPDGTKSMETVCVDADIDLYRSPVRHLFGEVLVNHLTGSKTDQFKVWDILASNDVEPIDGFEVIRV